METDFSKHLTAFGENFIDVINKMKLRKKLTLAEQRELIKILLIENYKYVGSNLHSLITEVSTNSKLSNREKLKYANDIQEFLNDKKYHFYFSHEIGNLYYSFASKEGGNTFNILLDTNNGDFDNYKDLKISLDEIESQIELNNFYKVLIKNIKWNFNLKIIHQLQPISLKKKLNSFPSFDDFDDSNIKSETDKKHPENRKIKKIKIQAKSFCAKPENYELIKNIIIHLNLKFEMFENEYEKNNFYNLLISDDFTLDKCEIVQLNCKTNEFKYIAEFIKKNLLPKFYPANIGRCEKINSDGDKIITRDNLYNSKFGNKELLSEMNKKLEEIYKILKEIKK